MDRPTDQLLQRILTSVAEPADEHVAQLIAEARAEAVAEVKDLLKSAMKASLLRTAAARLEAGTFTDPKTPITKSPDVQPQPESHDVGGRACYVYAVTRGSAQLTSALPAGMDPRNPVGAVRRDDVQAL